MCHTHWTNLFILIYILIVEIAPFPALRMISISGAVFTAPMYRWVYDVFPKYIYLGNGMGGTDICALCKLLSSLTIVTKISLAN
jgi:hypothetical protein